MGRSLIMKKLLSKSLSAILAGALLVSAIMTSCGGVDSSTEGNTSNTSDNSTSVSEGSSAAGQENKTLTVMGPAFLTPEKQQDWAECINEQTNITMEYEEAPLVYADSVNKMTTMLASGDDSIDIYHIDELMILSYLSAGFLEPIEDVVPMETTNDLLPGYAEKFLVRDNHLYGVGAELTGILFFVNQKMFDEAGVAVPTNQEEFIEAAQALTKDGQWGLIESWDKASHLQDNLNRWSMMFGGDYLDWTNPKTQEAIKFMYSLAQEYKVLSLDSVADNYEIANQKMNDGLGAMYFQWAGAAQTFKSGGTYGEEIVVAPMPTFETNHTPMSSWMFVLNKNSQNKDVAKEFLNAMTESDAVTLFEAGTRQVTTANTAAWKDPDLAPLMNCVEEHQAYLDAGSLTVRDLLIKQNEFMDTAMGTLQRYLLNEISFEECIEQGQKQIDELKN